MYQYGRYNTVILLMDLSIKRYISVNRLQVPQENIDIFTMLFILETALRELIIEELSKVEGPRWYKRCLPGDVLDKYRKGREAEKSIQWTRSIPHHPIYYVDFPDLKKIIERDENWKKAFERIFSRKDILSSTLSELEPIRNKIAHNRKASREDVEVVKGTYSKLSTAIGSDNLRSLSMRSTLGEDIPKRLIQLQIEAKSSLLICQELMPLARLKVWDSIHNEWWFDESYLGQKLDMIIEFFHNLEEYSHLPRLRGSGHKIEAWVKNRDIEIKYTDAQKQFDVILASEETDYGPE
jgi:Swt1-like HEPN